MILKIFIFWRLGLFLVTYMGSKTFPLINNGGLGAIGENRPFNFWASWAQWDGGHFYNIAINGYQMDSNFAFFPLYPALIRLLSFLMAGNYLLAGLLISNISFLVFLYMFYKFVKNKYSKNIAFYSTITFLVFPTTFFNVSYYSESIFLLLVIITFIFLSSKKFLLASILAFFASFSKLAGIFLAIAITYSYFANIKFKINKINRKILHISVAFLGLIIYSLYLLANYNSPLKFLSVQSIWGRFVSDPFSTIFLYIWDILTLQVKPTNDYFDLAITLIFLLVLILGARKISSSLWIFSMLIVLIPASTGTLTSMPRYLLASLGFFVILGQYLANRPKFRLLLWIVMLTLQAVFAVKFINGYWVA